MSFYIGGIVVGIIIGVIFMLMYEKLSTVDGEFLVDTSDENVDRYTFRFDNFEELKRAKYVKCKVIHWRRSAR